MAGFSGSTYALCRAYVQQTLEGAGALKGAPCTIKSITPHYSAVDPSKIEYNVVEFEWKDNSGATHTSTMNVRNGVGIVSMTYKYTSGGFHYYDVLMLDGSEDELTIPVAAGNFKKEVVDELPPLPLAQDDVFYLLRKPGTTDTYYQYIKVLNKQVDPPVEEWLNLGTTDVDLSGYQLKIDDTLSRNDYVNFDSETKGLFPRSSNIVGAINEHEDVIGSPGSYTETSGGVFEYQGVQNLKTYHKKTLVDAINDEGDLSKLEMWNPATQTPATLVDAINMAYDEYDVVSQTQKDPSTVDRTKQIDVIKVIRDAKDGSAPYQIGPDIDINRVDVDERASAQVPSTDYRTYDVKVADELKDPNDASAKPFGTIHIPKTQIKKIEPTVRYNENISIPASAWTNPSGNNWLATVNLEHAGSLAQSTPPTVTLSDGTPANIVVTPGQKTATITTGSTHITNDVTAAVGYDGANEKLSAQYYLEIEGLPYQKERCGLTIDIENPMLLDGVSVEECTIPDVPVPGLVPGDKYIDMRFIKSDKTILHAYIPCKDLFVPYSGYQAVHIDFDTVDKDNKIKLYIHDPENLQALTQSGDGLRIAKSDIGKYGVSQFANRTEVLTPSDSTKKTIKPYDVYDFANNSYSVETDFMNMDARYRGFYTDGSGKKPNGTIVKGMNELSTAEIEKQAVPEEGDVATYYLQTLPSPNLHQHRGDAIHIERVVIQTDTLVGITEPKDYSLYYLTQDENKNETGLYMYVNNRWVPVAFDDAIRLVKELPTENVHENCFYEIRYKDTVKNRYKLSDSAKEKGYWLEKDGLHFETTIVGWDQVLARWSEYINDEIVADPDNGPIYSVERVNPDGSVSNFLEYWYHPRTNDLYYAIKKADNTIEWIEVSPIFKDKFMDATENTIKNISTPELKPQLASDAYKTFIVDEHGDWKIDSIFIDVEELPDYTLETCFEGAIYRLKTDNQYARYQLTQEKIDSGYEIKPTGIYQGTTLVLNYNTLTTSWTAYRNWFLENPNGDLVRYETPGQISACHKDTFDDPTSGLKEDRYYLYGYKEDYGWIFITDGRRKVDFYQGEINAGKHLVVMPDGTVGLEESAIAPTVGITVDPSTVVAGNPTEVTIEVTVAKGNTDIERIQLYEDGTPIKEWTGEEVVDGGTFTVNRTININSPLPYMATAVDAKGGSGTADAMVVPKLEEVDVYFGTVQGGLSKFTATSREFYTTYSANYESFQYKYPASLGDLIECRVDGVGGYLDKTVNKSTETIGGTLYNVYTQTNVAKAINCPIEFY